MQYQIQLVYLSNQLKELSKEKVGRENIWHTFFHIQWEHMNEFPLIFNCTAIGVHNPFPKERNHNCVKFGCDGDINKLFLIFNHSCYPLLQKYQASLKHFFCDFCKTISHMSIA